MEYLEARRSLSDCRSALPLEQVLQYAIEIADALDKAHRKGVTAPRSEARQHHVDQDGTKLLDFVWRKVQIIRWSCNILKWPLEFPGHRPLQFVAGFCNR